MLRGSIPVIGVEIAPELSTHENTRVIRQCASAMSCQLAGNPTSAIQCTSRCCPCRQISVDGRQSRIRCRLAACRPARRSHGVGHAALSCLRCAHQPLPTTPLPLVKAMMD